MPIAGPLVACLLLAQAAAAAPMPRPLPMVPPPPGIAPSRVAVIERPAVDLDAAVRQVAGQPPIRPQVQPAPAAGSASESEALRRYVRGRLRMQDLQPVRASDDFDAALRLDPGSAALHAARAESASQAGDLRRAVAEWEATLQLAPDDVQALVAVGMAASEADQQQRSAALLGRAWQRFREGRFVELSDAGRATVGGALARALLRLGFDEAAIEVAEVALAASPEAIGSQRGDGADAAARAQAALARDAAEAALRAGRPAQASALLAQSVALVPDPRSESLRAFAALRAGDTVAARASVDRSVAAQPWLDPVATGLASWGLRAAGADEETVDSLEAALEEARESGAPAAEGRIARLVAAARPARAGDRLRDAVGSGATDAQTLEAAFAAVGDAEAPALAAVAVRTDPACLPRAARALVRASRDLRSLRTAVESVPDAALREPLAAAVRAAMRDPGDAWRRASSANERDPEARAPLEALLAAAVAAGDAALVERTAALADAGTDADLSWHVALARAFAETGAARAAERSLARAQRCDGAGDRPGARAIAEARAAIDGRAPEGSPRARAEEALPRGDDATAVAELLIARAVDRDDAAALGMLMRVLPRTEGARAASEWCVAELDAAPNDPLAWEAYVLQAVAGGRAAEAVARLDARLAADPDDTLVLGIREAALRASGRGAEALAAGRARTSSLPPGPRRALEQAALELQWGAPDRAMDALRAFCDAAYPPPTSLRSVALDLCRRVPASADGRAPVMRRIARDGILSDPLAPLEFYAFEALSAVTDPELGPTERADAAAMIGAEAAVREDLRLDAEPWRAAADFLVAQGQPAAGGAFLRARLEDPGELEDDELGTLVRAAVACDALVGGRADDAMALVSRLEAQGLRPLGAGARPASTYDALAGIFSVAGDRDGAERILAAGRAIDPDDPVILNNLAWSRLERGVADSATEALLRRSMELRPDDPGTLDSMGWLRALQGRLEDGPGGPGAVSLLRRAVAAAGRGASAVQQEHLGDVLWLSGDQAGAEAAWRESLRLSESGLKREEHLAVLRRVFRTQLGLAGIDAGRYHDEHEGALSARARARLDALANGKSPPVGAPAPAAAPK